MAPRRRWDVFPTSAPVMKPSARGGPDNYRSYVTISCPYCGWESNDLAEEGEARHKGEVCRSHLSASPDCAAQFGPFAPVQRKRSAAPGSPEAASPKAAAPGVAIGTPVGAAPQTGGLTRDNELHAKVDQMCANQEKFFALLLKERGVKVSSGSEDEAGKPARALDRYEHKLRNDELGRTAAVLGVALPPTADSLADNRQLFKDTLDVETKKRGRAEAAEAVERAARTARAAVLEERERASTLKRKYKDARRATTAANAAATAATEDARRLKLECEDARAKIADHEKKRRKVQRAVHPDRIPAELRTSEVRQYSTITSQEINAVYE